MSKGNPNDSSRRLPFVPKVYDSDQGTWRPLCIAPEATDKVLGDVYLSDAVNSTDNAKTGVTAATPAAVKTVNDNANNKLDKTTSSEQTVNSNVTFKNTVTAIEFVGHLTGDVAGNASTASALNPGASITIKGTGNTADTVTFRGNSPVTLTIGNIDASKIQGVLKLENIPQGALERVVSYISIQAAVSAWTSAGTDAKPFDIGDTIRVTGVTPNVMYVVTADPSKTASYVEYAAGTATNAIHADEADEAEHAVNADIATKVGTETVGSSTKPIFLQEGTATASTATVGSTTKPVYLNAGTITESNATVGSGVKPVYMSNGAVTASTSTVGATNRPVYMNAGTVTQISYTIDKSVPSDAKFTDTTYSVFKGSTTSAAGSSGLVPAPSAGANNRFLRTDGTWAVAGEVTGVKGNSETDYRVGNVNLTAANIGALALTGGTLTGNLTARTITPAADSTYNIGSSSVRYANIYADTFTGNLTGNVTGSLSGNATTATTASKVNQTLTLTGNVTGSVSLNATGTRTMTTTIADKAVTNGKLADDVGTVFVGSTEPTEAHVKLWVKI